MNYEQKYITEQKNDMRIRYRNKFYTLDDDFPKMYNVGFIPIAFARSSRKDEFVWCYKVSKKKFTRNNIFVAGELLQYIYNKAVRALNENWTANIDELKCVVYKYLKQYKKKQQDELTVKEKRKKLRAKRKTPCKFIFCPNPCELGRYKTHKDKDGYVHQIYGHIQSGKTLKDYWCNTCIEKWFPEGYDSEPSFMKHYNRRLTYATKKVAKIYGFENRYERIYKNRKINWNFDRPKSSSGLWGYRSGYNITINIRQMKSIKEVLDTMIHEIAHMIRGSPMGDTRRRVHDSKFKQIYNEIRRQFGFKDLPINIKKDRFCVKDSALEFQDDKKEEYTIW